MCGHLRRLRLALIVVVLVTLLFFCHGLQGGFQAAHGPTSTLKECAGGLLLQSLILLLAHIVLGLSTFRLDGSLSLLADACLSLLPAFPSTTPPQRC